MSEAFYEDGKEMDVQETRRLIGPKSYNDNWDLVNYTSELRDSNGSFFAFVDFHENEGSIRECPHCLEYEIHNRLKPRILEKGEQKPPDYDQFIQCWECGNIYPIYQSYPETQIKDSVETTDNPFENESIFLSTDSRAEQRRKGKKRKGRFSSKYENKDSDIQREIDKGLAVNILYDTSS